MNKLFVAIAQLLISLKLIKGYKLLKATQLNDMAKTQVDLESYCAELKAILQEKQMKLPSTNNGPKTL